MPAALGPLQLAQNDERNQRSILTNGKLVPGRLIGCFKPELTLPTNHDGPANDLGWTWRFALRESDEVCHVLTDRDLKPSIARRNGRRNAFALKKDTVWVSLLE
jgi:hypothetical protein